MQKEHADDLTKAVFFLQILLFFGGKPGIGFFPGGDAVGDWTMTFTNKYGFVTCHLVSW